jgi:signal peptidase
VTTAKRSAKSLIGGALLNLAAVGGVLCIAAVIAAVAFNITLIMFKTGSMSPTIPAGSLSVIKEIPAAEVQVGDVVTVARPGKLPVTHRVTSVSEAEGNARSITMRGDANAADDPAPYIVSQVRIVLFSFPGLAYAVVAVSQPLVMGGVTLAAAVLVTWAFWPRNMKRRRSPEEQPA